MSDQIDELVARSKQHPDLLKFHAFHAANPQILSFLVREARRVIESGEKGFSFANLWNYGRWVLKEKYRRGKTTTYKMNDHLVPFYGRAILVLCPDLNGRVALRGSTKLQGRCKADVIFGTGIAPQKTNGDYGRRLTWSDEVQLELGWHPTAPYMPTLNAPRKPRLTIA
jgi:hypothetical protein